MACCAATSFVDVHLSRISSGRPNCFVRSFLRTESRSRFGMGLKRRISHKPSLLTSQTRHLSKQDGGDKVHGQRQSRRAGDSRTSVETNEGRENTRRDDVGLSEGPLVSVAPVLPDAARRKLQHTHTHTDRPWGQRT